MSFFADIMQHLEYIAHDPQSQEDDDGAFDASAEDLWAEDFWAEDFSAEDVWAEDFCDGDDAGWDDSFEATEPAAPEQDFDSVIAGMRIDF